MKYAPVSDLGSLPVILTLQEIAAVYRISEHSIRKDIQRNVFRPAPFARYPYRWFREDVVRDIHLRRPKLKARPEAPSHKLGAR